MASDKLILACSECGTRNYSIRRKTVSGTRLEVKKHCPRCNKHTLHRETK